MLTSRLLLSFALLAAAVPAAAERPADRIAISGHGMIFDAKMNPIRADAKSLLLMQNDIIAAIGESKPMATEKNAARIADLDKLIAAQNAAPEATLYLQAAKINWLLRDASKAVRVRYAKRSRTIFDQARNLGSATRQREIRAEILQALIDSGLITRFMPPTTYMASCAGQDVPVPPDFAVTGSAWVNQGNLTANILAPGGHAEVWTWSDPVKRGACIALPRNGGTIPTVGGANFAGIICQSASTGKACFWDNMLRGDSQRIPWRDQPLRIRDIQDATNLGENCTACHSGNNVYIMSPDDPTWGKLLRGVLSGPRSGTFTTRVETSTDNTGGHPRYVPMGAPAFVNTVRGAGCAGACHETPTTEVTTRWSTLISGWPAASSATQPQMPPRCATATTHPVACVAGDPACQCYVDNP